MDTGPQMGQTLPGGFSRWQPLADSGRSGTATNRPRSTSTHSLTYGKPPETVGRKARELRCATCTLYPPGR